MVNQPGLDNPTETMAVAIAQHQAGNLPKAELLYRQILEQDPANLQALNLMGVIAHQVGQDDAALEYFDKALAINAREPNIQHNRGLSLQAKGLYNEALQAYNTAIELKPDFAEAYSSIGLLYQLLGKPGEAVAYYQTALQIQPDLFEARYQLGTALQLQGRADEALSQYEAVLQVNPNHPETLSNMGSILKAKGRINEAVSTYMRAIVIKPGLVQAHYNLGNAYKDLGRWDEATASYQQALKLKPDYAEVYNNLGSIYQIQNKLDKAIESYTQAIQAKPAYAEAMNNLGNVLKSEERYEEALANFQKALEINPNLIEVYNNLGNVYQAQNQPEKAIEYYERALSSNPRFAEARYNMGLSYEALDRNEEAIANYTEALRLMPNHIDALKNLGNRLRAEGKLDEAVARYEEALKHRPDHFEAAWNRSLIYLLQGNYVQGWPEYEWRLKKPLYQQRSFNKRPWDGTGLKGKTILVVAEQGFGDTIQCLRFLPQLKKQGGKIVVECQPQLKALLKGFPNIDILVETNSQEASKVSYDTYVYMMSLPSHFKTTLENLPPAKAPFKLNPKLTKEWQKRLQGDKQFKVGLVWSGSITHLENRHRSCPLSDFTALANIPDVSFYSLQVGPTAGQAHTPPDGMTLHDLGPDLQDFADTAAAISCMDLVITVDTAVAHLAGALQKPVWVLLCADPDWRWMLNREDSPWYPTAKLIRQPRLGDWKSVFQHVASDLEALDKKASRRK